MRRKIDRAQAGMASAQRIPEHQVLRHKEFKGAKDQTHSSTGKSGKILLLWAALLVLGRILLSVFFG